MVSPTAWHDAGVRYKPLPLRVQVSLEAVVDLTCLGREPRRFADACAKKMLPLTQPGAPKHAAPAFAEYAARMLRYRQMDFEYALWLMANLCISPRTAFRSTLYHSRTKHQWSSDAVTWHTLTGNEGQPQLLGGSGPNWAKDNINGDNREYLPFWGYGDDNTAASGCCFNKADGSYDGWSRPFDLYVGVQYVGG